MHTESSSLLRWVALAMMGVSFLGFMDTAYLTVTKLMGLTLKCGTSVSCSVVSNSPYASIFGIPLSLLGMIFYLVIFFGALAYREFENTKVLAAVSFFTVAGLLMSIYLTGIQAFVLNTFCRFCLFSAFTSTVLFILGMKVLFDLKQKTFSPSLSPVANDQE